MSTSLNPPEPDSSSGPSPHHEREATRPRIADIMAIIAGLAVSFWVFRDFDESQWATRVLIIACMILGGLSVLGPVLLLWERWRQRGQPKRPWRAGRILWFSTGAAAWLTWPPLVHGRFFGPNPKGGVGENSIAMCAYFYGTPLMALYTTTALLFGGWLPLKRLRRSRSRARRKPLPWRERFGLLLGLAWACTGLWVLYLMYFRSRD